MGRAIRQKGSGQGQKAIGQKGSGQEQGQWACGQGQWAIRPTGGHSGGGTVVPGAAGAALKTIPSGSRAAPTWYNSMPPPAPGHSKSGYTSSSCRVSPRGRCDSKEVPWGAPLAVRSPGHSELRLHQAHAERLGGGVFGFESRLRCNAPGPPKGPPAARRRRRRRRRRHNRCRRCRMSAAARHPLPPAAASRRRGGQRKLRRRGLRHRHPRPPAGEHAALSTRRHKHRSGRANLSTPAAAAAAIGPPPSAACSPLLRRFFRFLRFRPPPPSSSAAPAALPPPPPPSSSSSSCGGDLRLPDRGLRRGLGSTGPARGGGLPARPAATPAAAAAGAGCPGAGGAAALWCTLLSWIIVEFCRRGGVNRSDRPPSNRAQQPL